MADILNYLIQKHPCSSLLSIHICTYRSRFVSSSTALSLSNTAYFFFSLWNHILMTDVLLLLLLIKNPTLPSRSSSSMTFCRHQCPQSTPRHVSMISKIVHDFQDWFFSFTKCSHLGLYLKMHLRIRVLGLLRELMRKQKVDSRAKESV